MADEAPSISPSQFKASAGAPAPAAPAPVTAPPQKREPVVNNDVDRGSEAPSSVDLEANARTRDASVDGEHEPDALDALATDGDADGDDAAPDPLAEELHGMKAAEIIAAIKDGNVPEALFDALTVEIGEGDDKQRISLREALNESSEDRMRLRDFSRAHGKLRQREAALDARDANVVESLKRVISNPATSFEDLRTLGMSEETLEQACLAYAQERIAYREMSPQMRAIIDRDRETRRNQAQLEAKVSQLEREKAATTNTQRTNNERAVFDEHFGAACKKFGLIGTSKAAFNDFIVHANELKRASGKPLSRDVVYAAVKAAREDADERAKADRAANAPPAKQRVGNPLPPSRGAAPMAIKPAARRPDAFTPSQFAANVGKRA